MTSERILLGHLAARGVQPEHLVAGITPQRTSKPEIIANGFSEPTATIVWQAIMQSDQNPFDFVAWLCIYRIDADAFGLFVCLLPICESVKRSISQNVSPLVAFFDLHAGHQRLFPDYSIDHAAFDFTRRLGFDYCIHFVGFFSIDGEGKSYPLPLDFQGGFDNAIVDFAISSLAASCFNIFRAVLLMKSARIVRTV